MPKFDDFSAFNLGNLGMAKFMFRGAQVWPRTYVWTLTPSYSGSLDSMPASGGSKTITWTLTGTLNGTQVYQNTVTPTNAVLSDTSNFSYTRSSGVWKCNDRGANGYTNSSSSPSSSQWDSPARSCTLNVSYAGTVTINGQSVSVNAAAETLTMVQARNRGWYVSANNTFDNFSMSLANYYDSDHKAPACQAQTTASATARCGNYIEWSSGATRYYYQTIGNAFFDFSSTSDWISTSGNTITAASRGKVTGDMRSATIKATIKESLYPGVSGYASATFYQKANSATTIPATCSSLTFDSFKVNNVAVSKINDCKQTTVTVAMKATWKSAGTKYTAYDDGDSSAITQGTQHTNEAVTPDSVLEVTGADSTTKTTFTVTNKHTTSEKTWTIEATYLDKEASTTIKQVADTYTTTYPVERWVSMSVTSGSITAAGGSLTLSFSAKHRTDTVQTWVSDGVEKARTQGSETDDTSRATITLATSGPTGHADRFSRSGTTLTHSSMTNKEGTDKVTATITHPDDNTKTASTSEYSATNSKTYGNITLTADETSIAAAGGVSEFTATCPITWTSNYNDPGLSTSDFTFSIQSKANNGYRDYTLSGNELTFGSLAKNQRSQGTTTVRASHSGAGNKDINITELANSRGAGVTVDTPGQKTYGASYQEYDYSNYSLTLSLSQYNSSSSAAPFGANTYNNILSCSAGGHKERTMSPWSQPHHIVTTYTWSSGAQDVSESDTVEEGTDEGSWGNVADTPSVSSAQNWLTISGDNITVGANTGLARSCVITATVMRLDGGSAITKTVTFYQAKCVAISVDPDSLVFAVGGGTATFTVYYTNVTFSISHAGNGTDDPVSRLSSTSGGSGTSSGSKTITVTVPQNSHTNVLNGLITITPASSSGLAALEVDVYQEALYTGQLTAFVDCYWSSSSVIAYEWLLSNTSNVSKSAYLTLTIRRTASANDNPDTGSLVATVYIGTQTAPAASGGLPGTVTGSGTKTNQSQDTSYTYWARITGTGVTSSWQQFDIPD